MARRGGSTAGPDRRQLMINLRARPGEIDIFLLDRALRGNGHDGCRGVRRRWPPDAGHVGGSRRYGLNHARVRQHRARACRAGARAETGSARKLHRTGSPCYIRGVLSELGHPI